MNPIWKLENLGGVKEWMKDFLSERQTIVIIIKTTRQVNSWVPNGSVLAPIKSSSYDLNMFADNRKIQRRARYNLPCQ